MIVRFAAARTARSAAVWGVVFAAYIAVSALGYAGTYSTAAERAALARSFGSNVGVAVLLGPAGHIDTVTGFTSWRCVAVLGLIGAVWGLLTGTRLLRGEEDAGRWELLLAGPTTRAAAGRDAVAGMLAGFAALLLVPAVVTAAVGRSHEVGITPAGALLLAVGTAGNGAVFLLVGALASQLATSRRQAGGIGAATLAVAFTLRAVGDSGLGLGWLRWLSPLGWVEELHPLTSPRLVALVPLAATVAVLAAVVVRLAARRDLGAGLLARHDGHIAPRPVTNLVGLTVRMVRGASLGWLAAVAFAGLMFGLIAKSAGHAIASMRSAQQELERLGAHGLGARAYLGVAFFVVAAMLTLVAANAVAAIRAEEAEGRLEHLLVRPVGRLRWLGSRLAPVAVLLAGCGTVAGMFAWLGAAAMHSGTGFGELVRAGVNTVPAGVFVLGVGVLGLGFSPRLAAPAAYAVLAWSFLVQLIGSLIGAQPWLLDLSLFRHMAPAPALPVDWRAAGIVTLLGVAAAGAGALRFRARDLAGA